MPPRKPPRPLRADLAAAVASSRHDGVPAMAETAIRIGLLWHSVRSGNLGVGALTVGNISLLREVCAELDLTPSFVVIGPREPGAAYVEDDDVTSLDVDSAFLLSPRGFWRAVSSIDC